MNTLGEGRGPGRRFVERRAQRHRALEVAASGTTADRFVPTLFDRVP